MEFDAERKRIGEETVPTVTSLKAAEFFGMEHYKILRTIRRLERDGRDFAHRNYAEGTYTDKRGRGRPLYVMTRDGFLMLGMSLGGKKADAFREAFVVEMDRTESELMSIFNNPSRRGK